jgi:threonylcarbamoyladenosine tRNA methylthiotransferase MtaB
MSHNDATTISPGRLSLITQGCKVNQYETQVLLEDFLARGWRIVPFGEVAEITVINSCTVTEGSDRDLRKLVKRANRISPDGQLIVTGCRVQVDPAAADELAGVDHFVDNLGKLDIPGLMATGELKSRSGGVAPELFPRQVEDRLVTGLAGRGRPIIKVQDGCNLRCSYCIVPLARGDSRSRPVSEVVRQAQLLTENGAREAVLSGIQLGLFRDPESGGDLTALLRNLLAGTEGIRFRLGSMLPRHVTPELLELLKNEPRRLCPHLHISMQSGDDMVLQAMKRPYSSKEYRALLESAIAALPNLCLGTDIIAGFPCEDGESFARTLEFVRGLPLAYGHVFPFSPRKGTPADGMADLTARDEKLRRGRLLREALIPKGELYRERQVGKELMVIVEKGEPGGRFSGTSENFQTVNFPDQNTPSGGMVSLQVTGINDNVLLARSAEEVS